MENLNITLFKLLKDELDNLAMGNSYNISRLRLMKEICYVLIYEQFVTINPVDMLRISKLFKYKKWQ